MKWMQVSICTAPEAEEVVSDILMDAGAQGVMVEGDVGVRTGVDELDMDEGKGLPFVVSAFFPAGDSFGGVTALIGDRLHALEQKEEGAALGTLETTVREVDEEDWANGWKAYFKPVRVSAHVVIKPTWEEYTPEEGDVVVEIDPGMAFGTGAHESTRMCIGLLEEYIHGGELVLDVGCGSGVLAVAAMGLSTGKAYAMDYDEVAVGVTRENIALNGYADKVEVLQSDLLAALGADVRADIVIANIIADIIIRLTPDIKQHLKPGGVFICSGVIEGRVEDVVAVLKEQGFVIKKILEEGEWRAIACM
mgnify:CR=1 FL=1